jgi:hypothetical protein
MLPQMLSIEILMDIWERTIGSTPARQQFEIWAVDHSLRIIKESILVTARKNLSTKLSQDACIRFATGVMNAKTQRVIKYHGGAR